MHIIYNTNAHIWTYMIHANITRTYDVNDLRMTRNICASRPCSHCAARTWRRNFGIRGCGDHVTSIIPEKTDWFLDVYRDSPIILVGSGWFIGFIGIPWDSPIRLSRRLTQQKNQALHRRESWRCRHIHPARRWSSRCSGQVSGPQQKFAAVSYHRFTSDATRGDFSSRSSGPQRYEWY